MGGISELGPAVRGLSAAGRRSGSARHGLGRRAGHRTSAGRRGHVRRPRLAQRLQTRAECPEAGPGQRALRVAGRGGGDGHPESDAGLDGQGVERAGGSPLHRRVIDGPRPERAGDCREAVPQYGLGQHAEESAGGAEPGDCGGSLPRGLSGVLLHVHVAAVQAHEGCFAGATGAFCEGRGGPAAEHAGHRALGSGVLPRAGLSAGGDRGGQAELVAAADEVRAGGPGGLQRVRAGVAGGHGQPAEVPAAGAAEMSGPAAAEPGLFRSGQPVGRWAVEPVRTFSRRNESVL
jgi:hypothetical protein